MRTSTDLEYTCCMTHDQRAAGVLIWKRDVSRGRPAVKWLLLRNARLGHWGFAKGHLEAGETELAGALREVLEETGLRPALDPAFREVLGYEVPATKKRPASWKEVAYFLGSVAEAAEVEKSEEHDRVEWLPADLACERLEHEQLRALLRRAERFRASR
jgi:8-oxo-dGTP pyrophosphatase MutT (NUDIX family)